MPHSSPGSPRPGSHDRLAAVAPDVEGSTRGSRRTRAGAYFLIARARPSSAKPVSRLIAAFLRRSLGGRRASFAPTKARCCRAANRVRVSKGHLLTDGLGEGIIERVVTRLDTGEEIQNYRGRIAFPEMLQEVTYHLRLSSCRFPVEGLYQFTLLVDGEWIAHRRLRVY